MLDEILGLPTHPLVVHAALVFVPLLALAVVAYTLLPRLRDRMEWVLLALAVVAPVTAWLARLSGDRFREQRFPGSPPGDLAAQLTEHKDFGDIVAWTSLALGIAAILLVVLARRTTSRAARPILAAISVVLAGVVVYYVTRSGHSGATMVWGS